MRRNSAVIILLLCIVIILGCRSAYYTVWETLGKEKRHLLKDQVEKARDEQQEASEQFKDALTQIKELYGFRGGDLEDLYVKLRNDYESIDQGSR